MPIKTVRQQEIPRLVSSVAKSTGAQLTSMLEGNHKFFFGNRAVQCQPIDALRWFTETIPDSSRTLHIRNIMVNAVNDSENIQGSSAVVCAASLSCLLTMPGVHSENEIFEDLRIVSSMSRRASSDTILQAMKCLDGDSTTFSMARAAITGCSSSASIQVTKGSRKTTVKRVNGYKFPLTIPEVFVSAVGGAVSERRFNSPRALIVDGFIETAAEIDGVVRSSYESKSPLIIVARGYAPDVLNTLGVNYAHGHLSIVPLVVPFDELGVNMINDVAVVLRSEIVSSTKGEIISARKWENLGTVDSAKVNFSTGTLTVNDESVKNAVKMQRKFLREGRKNAETDVNKELYDRRLGCLMGEGVVIDLGEDLKDLTGIYTDRLNSHIRNYRSGAKFGIVRITDCLDRVKNKTTSKILKQLQTISETYTTLSLLVGIKNAVVCTRHMGQIGGIIYNDRRR